MRPRWLYVIVGMMVAAIISDAAKQLDWAGRVILIGGALLALAVLLWDEIREHKEPSE